MTKNLSCTKEGDLCKSVTSSIVNRVRNKYCTIVYVNKLPHSECFHETEN